MLHCPMLLQNTCNAPKLTRKYLTTTLSFVLHQSNGHINCEKCIFMIFLSFSFSHYQKIN